MGRFSTTIERNSIEKLEDLFNRWHKLKNRRTQTQIAKETENNGLKFGKTI